jgi:cell shape-determining protein MreC
MKEVKVLRNELVYAKSAGESAAQSAADLGVRLQAAVWDNEAKEGEAYSTSLLLKQAEQQVAHLSAENQALKQQLSQLQHMCMSQQHVARPVPVFPHPAYIFRHD